MLLVNVAQIPPEGMDLDTEIHPGEVHLDGEESFVLQGGSLRGRVERGDENTVHLRGRLVTRLGLECGRCLEGFTLGVDQELDLFYLPHREDQGDEEEDEVELSDREMVVAYYRNDRLDLGEIVREQVFLALPLKRVCREECLGLCPACGTNRNASRCTCAPVEAADPRLAALRKLLERGSS